MILSFINIRKIHREFPSGFTHGFQHFPRDLAVHKWKIIFDSSSDLVLAMFKCKSYTKFLTLSYTVSAFSIRHLHSDTI